MTRLIGGTISDTPIKDIGDGSAFSAGGGAETDPLFDNVELLLMPEDGDTTIDDKSSNARTVTNTGPVSIVSDVASPTGYAMDFGTQSQSYYLTFSEDDGLKPGTGDFCIETICKVNNTATAVNCLTGSASGGSAGGSVNFPWFYGGGYGVAAYPGPGLTYRNDDTNIAASLSGVSFQGPAYHHYALTRSGSTVRYFCDGVEETSFSPNTTDLGSVNWTAFIVGMWGTPSTRRFGGRAAMLRLTIGAARYTSNFSPFAEFPKA